MPSSTSLAYLASKQAPQLQPVPRNLGEIENINNL